MGSLPARVPPARPLTSQAFIPVPSTAPLTPLPPRPLPCLPLPLSHIRVALDPCLEPPDPATCLPHPKPMSLPLSVRGVPVPSWELGSSLAVPFP